MSAPKAIMGLLMAAGLAGCGAIQAAKQRENAAAVWASVAQATDQCKRSFPAGIRQTAVARARCLNDAEGPARAIYRYPDLIDLRWATRLAIAEREQNGQISNTEAMLEFAQHTTRLTAEEQTRMLANRSVSAQESVARAAYLRSLGTTCTTFGNSVTCN